MVTWLLIYPLTHSMV